MSVGRKNVAKGDEEEKGLCFSAIYTSGSYLMEIYFLLTHVNFQTIEHHHYYNSLFVFLVSLLKMLFFLSCAC